MVYPGENLTMTTNKDLKRLVRARMQKTGESYTTARTQILRKPRRTRRSAIPREAVLPPVPETARLINIPGPSATTDLGKIAGMTDAKIQPKTSHSWEEWVHLLDGDGAAEMSHPEIAKLVSDKYGVPAWWTQAVTVGYERIKGLRARGQRRDGTYEASKSKTFNVSVAELFDAWADPAVRRRWLDAADVQVKTATRPRSMRLRWNDGSVIALWFTAKGKKSVVSVQHTRLRDRATAGRLKEFWAERLQSLAKLIEPL